MRAGVVAVGQPVDAAPSRAPSATSLMVKSNSLRATKSTAVACLEAACGSTATLAPTRPTLRSGLRVLQRLDGLDVGRERRRRGVQHDEVVVVGLAHDVGRATGRCGGASISLRALDQRGGLGEPGRIPEGLDLAASPGSASRRRRRSRRRTAPAGTGSSSWRRRSPVRYQGAFRLQFVAVSSPAHTAGRQTPRETRRMTINLVLE